LTAFGEITDLSIFEQVMVATSVLSIVPARPISKPIEDSGGYLFTLW